MDHRIDRRVQGKLGLLVFKRGMPVATGRIRNASRQGLFIATDYGGVQPNDIIELEFSLSDDKTNPFRSLKAQVIRKADNGLGVCFDGVEHDSFTIASLIQWLEKHHLPKRHFAVCRRAY